MSKNKYTVSVDEAAKRLDVSRRTIYRRLNNDKLDGKKKRTKHGDKWFISEEEFSKQAEVIQEVVETERKVDINDLKQEIKEVFLETQKEIIKETINKQREVIKEDIKDEIKKETEKIDKTVNEGLDQVKESFEETAVSIPQAIKEEQKEHREWINQRDRKLMRNIRRMQKKQNKEEEETNQGLWNKLIKVFR